MNSTDNLFGKIKTIIRKKENPKMNDGVGLLTKLIEADKHLMTIKSRYTEGYRPEVIMAPLTLKTTENVPKWFRRLIPTLERYLDVVIIRDKRLIDNYVEPIYSLTVIGERSMAILATHYIDTIFTTITRLVAFKREALASKAKINRRRKRQGESVIPLGDARELASQTKETIILSILGTLEKLLQGCLKEHPVTWTRGLLRKDYIETQLKLKYSNRWRSGLSTRYG